MKEKLLQELGLTGNESKIYLELLKEGNALAGTLTEKTGIHRRNVYDAIQRLIEKGLVSHVIVDNKKLFSPANPNRFLEIIEERKFQLDEKKKEFEKILPELNSLKSEKKKHDVRFFKGVEGLKTVYEDILRTGENYIGFGPGEEIEKILKFYFKHYVEKRISRKIKSKLIYNESSRNKDYTKEAHSEVRFMPAGHNSHAALRIYGDKVAIMLLEEETPLAILIRNKAIADGYRKYFNVIWNAAEK